MLGTEPGWYRDPAPANPATPETVRYWDGQQWTAQVKPAPRQVRAAWRSEVAAERARQPAPSGGYAGQPETSLDDPLRMATPDGQRLAGWWSRVAAFVVDDILVGLLGLAVGWRLAVRLGDTVSAFYTEALEAARAGQPPPDGAALTTEMAAPLAGLMLVLLSVKLLYGIGFLKACQATPGKLLLGLRVRLRERPGPLPWGTVLGRVLGQNLGRFAGFVPVIGLLGYGYSLLNALWPLWDPKRQALHDKMARTNVVRHG